MAQLKISAFSLFESVVAIVIISVCIGIGSLIYSNIIGSEEPLLAIEGFEEANVLFENLKANKRYINDHFAYENFSIEQNIKPYRGDKHILVVNYNIYRDRNLIGYQRHLIFNEEHE